MGVNTVLDKVAYIPNNNPRIYNTVMSWYGTVRACVGSALRFRMAVARWLVGGCGGLCVPVGRVCLSCLWIGGVFRVSHFAWVQYYIIL